jgi:hypothetical protein
MMATTAAMVTTATMMPNGKDDNENQAATAARVITMVARATVIGAKRAMATMARTATTAMMAMTVAMAKMVTMTPHSNDAASGDKGNEDTNDDVYNKDNGGQWASLIQQRPTTPPLRQRPCRDDAFFIIQLPPTGLTLWRNT